MMTHGISSEFDGFVAEEALIVAIREAVAQDCWRIARKFMRELADTFTRRIEFEEEQLFPHLEPLSASMHELIVRMRDENRELSNCIASTLAALDNNDATAVELGLHALQQLVRRHGRTEAHDGEPAEPARPSEVEASVLA